MTSKKKTQISRIQGTSGLFRLFFTLLTEVDVFLMTHWRMVHGKISRSYFRPVHEGILDVMKKVEADRYHESKCCGFRRQWAGAASAKTERLKTRAVTFEVVLVYKWCRTPRSKKARAVTFTRLSRVFIFHSSMLIFHRITHFYCSSYHYSMLNDTL
ncbi:uncharacterized protein EDB91DRAFT_78125 [Suillus paluster]|uniref:uncharacterized protein n=1 Tax=Suillus paluster TaxID=48578 RepID=UPI001B865C5A|nr:uncharacterized protein EDB91DRAFT_78125 [Suillus paluster]KAG1726003.1 hypothetical protein EDB91DRAFT_78125 [Suillus paluster]